MLRSQPVSRRPVAGNSNLAIEQLPNTSRCSNSHCNVAEVCGRHTRDGWNYTQDRTQCKVTGKFQKRRVLVSEQYQ